MAESHLGVQHQHCTSTSLIRRAIIQQRTQVHQKDIGRRPWRSVDKPATPTGTAMAVGDGSSADACHGTRLAGGSRVLLIGLAATKFAPLFMSGLHDAGWEVGVLQRPPNNSTRAWHSGSPPLIRFSRSVWKRDDKVDALIGAVSSWRPALVIPDFRTSSKLMISAVRKLERASAPLAPAKQAALDILRCSLPRRREHWDRVNDKLKLMAELSGVDGVEAPWHQQLSDPQGLLRGTAASKDRLRALERRLPLVVKTNSDGNGKGVQLCRSRDALTSALKQAAERGEGVLLEQLIDGTHAEFAGSALDGQLLSGFSYLDVVSMGEVGAAVLLRTTNLPAATRQVAAAVAALGYTGCLQVDFRVDRSGRVFFVDPNMVRARARPASERARAAALRVRGSDRPARTASHAARRCGADASPPASASPSPTASPRRCWASTSTLWRLCSRGSSSARHRRLGARARCSPCGTPCT